MSNWLVAPLGVITELENIDVPYMIVGSVATMDHTADALGVSDLLEHAYKEAERTD